jgi:AcrR family transcriptional regulator
MTNETERVEPSVKERIEACAMDLFARKGFASTSVREIVEAAGVTKPSLYYYHKNKDDLFRHLYFSNLEAFLEKLEELASSSKRFPEKLADILRLYFEWLRKKPKLAAFLYRAIFGETPLKRDEELQKLKDRDDRIIEPIFKQAREKGELPAKVDTRLATILFIGHVNVFIARRAVGFEDDLNERVVQKTLRQYLYGIHKVEE